MKLEDLKPNPRNPRRISQVKKEMLENSLKEFGDLSGIIVNEQTGHIVSGHQRWNSFPKDLEIVRDSKDHGHVMIGGDRFHVRFVNWDEGKETAALVAANKHSGDWDKKTLSELFVELDSIGADLSLTGFEMEEIENIVAPEENVSKKKSKIKCPECGHKFMPE